MRTYLGLAESPNVKEHLPLALDDLEYEDPRWQAIKQSSLRDARTNFAAFYQAASPEDATIVDTLVMARHVFKYLAATPRQFLLPEMRQALERQNHHAEQRGGGGTGAEGV